MAGTAQHARRQEEHPLAEARPAPVQQRRREGEQADRDALPDHDRLRPVTLRQRLGDQRRGGEQRGGAEHQEVVEAAGRAELGADHDEHADEADAGRHPALPHHLLPEGEDGAGHDEDRAGEADRRGVRQGEVRQGHVPQHHAGGVDDAAPELADEAVGRVGAQPDSHDERRHHQKARGVAQELHLQRIHLHRDQPEERVQDREHEPRGRHPGHGLHGRAQAGQGQRPKGGEAADGGHAMHARRGSLRWQGRRRRSGHWRNDIAGARCARL